MFDGWMNDLKWFQSIWKKIKIISTDSINRQYQFDTDDLKTKFSI